MSTYVAVIYSTDEVYFTCLHNYYVAVIYSIDELYFTCLHMWL